VSWNIGEILEAAKPEQAEALRALKKALMRKGKAKAKV